MDGWERQVRQLLTPPPRIRIARKRALARSAQLASDRDTELKTWVSAVDNLYVRGIP